MTEPAMQLAAEAAQGPSEIVSEGPEVVGFRVRAGARILDTLVCLAISAVAGIVAFVLLSIVASLGGLPADWFQKAQETGVTGFLWGLTAVTLYHTVAEAVGGATIGKLIVGVRVLSDDFRPCSIKGAAIRSLGYCLDSLFLGMVAYSFMSDSPLKQRVGDKWGRTVVVKAASVPAGSRRGGGLVFVGAAGGGAVAMLCYGFSVVFNALL